jgi:CheY-like chemotaxis protein
MKKLKQATILLVEDDIADQKLIKQSLQNQLIANELKIAGSAEDAINYLENSKTNDPAYPTPDLILLDLNMPGMDGKNLLKMVKADSMLDTIPVVILTTSDSDRDVIESFKLQAAGYVKKPVSLVEFQKVLADLTDYWFVICKQAKHNKEDIYDRNICLVN